jgi:hypothetical protein
MVDTSALARRNVVAVDDRLLELLADARLSRCGIVDLELLRGVAAGKAERVAAGLDATLGLAPTGLADVQRAREVQLQLAARGEHHGVPAADLVIAAVAERAGATLVHYDADFDRIATVTGQPVEWVVPRGEAD